MSKKVIDRPPRILPELPVFEVKFPAPPQNANRSNQNLLTALMPMLMMVGMLAGISNGNGMLMALMAVLMLAFAGFGIREFVKQRKQTQRQIAEYHETLKQLRRDMERWHDIQRIHYHHVLPDAQSLVAIAQQKTESRFGIRLWERRRSDNDFGAVCLGIASRASTVIYTIESKNSDSETQQSLRDAIKLHDDSRIVHNAPVSFSLCKSVQLTHDDTNELAPRHSVCFYGRADAPLAEFSRSVIAQLATLHSPDDLRLFVLANDYAKPDWNWCEWLPHCCNEVIGAADGRALHEDQICFINPESEHTAARFWSRLSSELNQRQLDIRRNESSHSVSDAPLLVLVVDMRGKNFERSPLKDVLAEPVIALINEHGPALNAAVIFLTTDKQYIPSECSAICEVSQTESGIVFRYAETGLNTARYVGAAHTLSADDARTAVAAQIRYSSLRKPLGADLPRTLDLLQLHNVLAAQTNTEVTMVEQLPMRELWRQSMLPENAEWMRSPIGMVSTRDVRTLIFSAGEGGDGSHGLIAGTTGSGKSELLLTLIAGLVVRYDPRVVNLILVDYKGGTTFDRLRSLPHVVEVFTSTQPQAIERMFTALHAVMDQRASLLAASGVQDVVEYRRKAPWRVNPTLPQDFPHLFIIVDEFAEMLMTHPEFRAKFESITRLGRAFGITLILSTQRPAGMISDQMRANIKLRICLRVETPDDSNELLGIPDAALLPNIGGRGYIQNGTGMPQKFQVARTGSAYSTGQLQELPDVIWLDDESGAKAHSATSEPIFNESTIAAALHLSRGTSPATLIDWITGMAGVLSDTIGVPRQRQPWPPSLPSKLSLTDAIDATFLIMQRSNSQEAAYHLAPALIPFLSSTEPHRWQARTQKPSDQDFRIDIGLVDDPHEACQRLLTFALSDGPHILFGSGGTGKTTFLKSILCSFAARHTPEFLHVYGLDFAGGMLGAIDDLPHVGALINASNPARVDQMFRMLRTIIEERKARLQSKQGAGDGGEDLNLPRIMLVIDNIAELRDSFEHTLAELTVVLREGRQFGIHVIATANTPSDLPAKMYGLFAVRMTLAQIDSSKYADVVGQSVRHIDAEPGRGAIAIQIKGGSRVVEFQLGILTGEADEGDIDVYATVARRMEAAWMQSGGQRPAAEIPESVPILSVLAAERRAGSALIAANPPSITDLDIPARWSASLNPGVQRWPIALIGLVSSKDVRMLQMHSQSDGVHGIIAGTTGSGKSELLQTLIVALAVEHDPRVLNFVLIDYKGGATIEPFRKLPHVVEMASNLQPNSVERVFVAVKAEIDRRSAVLAEAGVSDLVDYRRNIAPNLRPDSTLPHEFPHLLIIVDEFAEMLQANPDYRVQFEQITRLGRAVGVSLLLATQKPAGVVSDQMRANMKLRIALRVESPEDSREILRRSDAAHLPHIAGRGYIQTGTDAITEIQIAWAGMDYTGARDSRYSRDEVASILETSAPPRSALTWLVAAMALEAQRASIPPQRAPWPPPLPHKLHFHDSLDTTYIHDTNNATASLEPARRSHGHHSGLPAADREAEGSPVFTDGRSTGSLHPWITGSTDVLHEQWQPHPWTTPLNLKIPVGLADDPETACQRIVYVNPMTDPVIVFGASGRGKTSFLRSFTLALAARYSPQDFNVYAIDFGKGGLRFLRSLPHCGAVVESASNEKLESLFRMLHGLLRDRQDKLRVTASIEEYNCSKSGQPDKLFPAILVIIDNLAEFKDEYERLLPDLIALVRDGRALGMYFLFSATRPSDLPAKLAGLMNQRFSMYQPNPEIYSDIFGRRTSALQDIPGRGFAYIEDRILQFQTVVPAIPALKGKADPVSILAQEMEDEWSRRGGKRPSAEIPRTADFLEMYSQVLGRPVTRISDLHIHEQWMQSMEPAHQEWLEAPFGYVSNREVRRLVFSAKPGGDGVHGMGAGTTGSGKSELLQTIIASLAVRYDPRIVNFVLIDYKGGATIEPFRTLPHTVDLATNLEPAAVHRIFKSIRAELDRRAKILARAGVADLVEYRRKIIPHLTVNSDLPRSFPHLFVVVDEFAEMIQANPDYRALFEQLTRLGRSFGVSLLLATQRPTGVVSDQMKANMKFRLCLRVETSDDSREILGRTDAMSLPSIPGRGYLQVGGGTTAEFQAGYSGVQYDPGDDDPNFSRSEIMAAIQDRIAIADGDASAEPPRTLLAWLVGAMALEANRSNIPVQRKPWPNQLPATLPWDRAIDAQHIPGVKTDTIVIHPAFAAWSDGDASAWQALTATPSDPPPLRVAVGLLDQPSDAAQRVLELDLSSDACLILGATGRGKTTFLKTLVLGLAATYRPNQLHLYGFDFGRGGLRALYTLPHTGGFVDSADSERVERLFGILSDIVAERQQLMQSFESFEHYNRANPGSQLARVVVIIDNVAEFRETYESRLAQLMAILREGRAFGVHFVITGSLISDVPIRLFNMLNQRITFYQTDPGDYATIFGKGCPRIPDLPGRGIAMHPTKDSPIPLEFHAATPSIGDLQLVIDQMRVTWQSICESDPRMRSRTAQSIHPLPSIIPLVELLQDTPSSNTANNVPFGHNDRDRKLTLLELETKGPHLLVIGPPMSGKTTTVQTMVLAMAHTYSPQHTAFILIDAAETSRTFFNLADHRGRRIADLPHVLATISSPNEAVDVVRRLSSEFRDLPDITKQNSRSHPESTPPERRIVIVMDNFEDISNQLLTSFAELGKGRGLSFIAACGTGMQHNISNPLKRRIESARYSFVLQDPELVRSLGARPASLPSRELPAGRGWFIKGARPTLIQVATVLSDSDAHTNLGLLFDVIHDKWDEPATWTHPYDPAAEVSSQDANQTSQFKMTPDLNAIAYSNQESIDAKTAFLQLSASAQTTPLLSLDDIPAVSNLVSLEVELPSKETSKET